MVMKYTVISTFNQDGYNQYGSRMIDTFLKTWPQDVELWVYAENCQVQQHAPNLRVFDLHQVSPELVAFKNKWRDVPKANGHPFPGAGRKAFKWQAVRFSHKVYSIFHAARNCNADWLIWMDADMVCHSHVSKDKLANLFPADKEICYAGRSNKFTECGLYGLHLTQSVTKLFVTEFQRMYDDADNGIFTLKEWHDSYVFDAVRKKFNMKELNWSAGLINGEGHPLINCEWGAYIDHLKGNRKDSGKSLVKDLIAPRREAYWQ
jgi:hypothetical protein